MDSPMPDSRSYARAWGELISTLWAGIRRAKKSGQRGAPRPQELRSPCDGEAAGT